MTVYYPLKSIRNDFVIYQCIPYDVVGSWKAFSSLKDKIEFFAKCFLSEKRCAHYCIKQMNKENNDRWF